MDAMRSLLRGRRSERVWLALAVAMGAAACGDDGTTTTDGSGGGDTTSTTTAITTACGFGALLVCRFHGLWDLGAVGLVGVLAGLCAALVVIPVGLVLTGRAIRDSG